MVLRWLPLMALLLGSCPGVARVRADNAVSTGLVCEQGRLCVSRPGQPARSIAADKPVPYAIAAQGPPALVTTCGADLRPVTYAAADPPVAYPEALPLLCDPPLTAVQ